MVDRLPSTSTARGRRGDAAEASDGVGDFRIDAEIGKGSFATVYRGYHRVSERFMFPSPAFSSLCISWPSCIVSGCSPSVLASALALGILLGSLSFVESLAKYRGNAKSLYYEGC